MSPIAHLTDQHQLKKIPSNDNAQYIVQKFGGTSLGKYPLNIVENVIIPHSRTHKIVSVCSARSLDTKAGGTTSRLLSVANDICKPDSSPIETIMYEIETEHIEAVHGYIKCSRIARSIIEDIRSDCRRVTALLTAARALGQLSVSCLERIVSTGEKLSARLLCAILQDQGVWAEYVDLSECAGLPEDQISQHEMYNQVSQRLAARVRICAARVVVVTGYFGRVPGGLLNSVGRGYTDLCAVLLTAGIPQSELQVWKELDGLFTADPRRVRTARLLDTLSPAEAAELTFYGSEVIQSLAMAQAACRGIPITVKGVMNPNGRGSLVTSAETTSRWAAPPLKMGFNKIGDLGDSSREDAVGVPGRPVALTTKTKVVVIRVRPMEQCLSHNFFAKIFMILDKWRLSVDLMSTSAAQVSMALSSKTIHIPSDAGNMQDTGDVHLQGAIQDLRLSGCVELIPKMAIVSVIGRRIQQTPDLASSIFVTLGKNNIQTVMICQGASEISISCVIPEPHIDRAICVLHEGLFACLAG
ncbi:aspartokinase [Xylaria intraflava]|nr:aspartokinase [Xylaria intraflava]